MKKLIYKKRIINFTLMLAILSGFVNASMILRYGYTVSHHTGNISKIAMGITEGKWLTPFLIMTVCFVLGSALTGFIFEKRQVGEISKYIKILGILIAIFVVLNFHNSVYDIYLISFAMGLQNGCVFFYHSFLLRSTHMSGYLSDLGFCIGMLIRSKGKRGREAVLFFIHIVFFIIGGVAANLISPVYTYIFAVLGYICVVIYLYAVWKKGAE